jgi:NAD(P)-dependent dehydrogenase (short-subunit alcohol dehydrogenase family)
MEIAGKVAVVTGGAHRVGGAITRALALAGANVAFTYNRSAEEADRLRRELRRLDRVVHAIPCDVGDWDAVQAVGREIDSLLGGADIVVNSASFFRSTPFPAADARYWRQVMRVTLDGAFFVSSALTPMLQRRGGGVIVNILDSCLWKPVPGFAAHAAAKGGLAALTRQLAVDLAPTIRVNGVAPGPVMPPAGLAPARQAALARETLLDRWGTPEDVARAVCYLIEADYVTGEIMVVDGGERFSRSQ